MRRRRQHNLQGGLGMKCTKHSAQHAQGSIQEATAQGSRSTQYREAIAHSTGSHSTQYRKPQQIDDSRKPRRKYRRPQHREDGTHRILASSSCSRDANFSVASLNSKRQSSRSLSAFSCFFFASRIDCKATHRHSTPQVEQHSEGGPGCRASSVD